MTRIPSFSRSRPAPRRPRLLVQELEDRSVPTAVALLAAEEPSWVPDVQAKLEATGQFTSVTYIDVAFQSPPTLTELGAYDAVLVWNNYSFSDPDALGDTLADYVDAGHGVVVATFANANSFFPPLLGRWASGGYDAIDPSDYEGFNPLTLGAVAQPGHPIMAGVTDFSGGNASWHSLGGVSAGSSLIASWSNGSPLVAERSALDIGLNFFPPSSDVYSDGWDSGTQGALLMANALSYVAGFGASLASPAAGGVVFAPPTDFVVNFNAAYDPTSVDAGDLTVNGVPAASVTQTDPDTLTFHFAASPVTVQGVQAVHLAAGSVLGQAGGEPTRELNATFRYDALLMTVTSTGPAAGSVVPLPFTTLDLNFNEAYDPLSAKPEDFTASQGTVTAVSVVDADTLRLTFTGVVAEGTLTVTMPAGAMTDVYGNPGAAFAASYILDFGTAPYPTPLKAHDPAGSLVYHGTQAGVIDPAGDSDSFSILVDPGQKITVTVDPAATLRPVVELYRVDSTGPALIGTSAGASAGREAVLQTVASHGQLAVMGPGPKTYLVTVRGAAGTTGAYAVRIVLNAALEAESHDGPANDTRPTAQDLGPAFLSFNASVGSNQGSGFPGSAAVLGTLEAATLNVVDADDFESGALDGQWATFSSQPQGRVRVTGEVGTAAGAFALAMDRDPAGANNLNEAVWTVDLTGQTEAVLRFAHADFNDEENSLPLNFAGHANGDGVAISADGVNWRRVLNATDIPFGTWQTVAIDLAAEAAAAGMALGPNFRIKFQQYDNFPLFTDGRAYDQIAVGVPVVAQDYYSLSLKAGETVTLAQTGGAGLQLQNAAGTTLATAAGGPTNVDRIISDWVAPRTGTYYARLSNAAFAPADYALVVTRNAGFDTEGNNARATAQAVAGPQVAGRQWVLGAIANEGYQASAVPFAFEDISGTGTPVLQGVDDDLWFLGPAELNGFSFDFYGRTYSDLTFSSNGMITLGGFNADYFNTDLTDYPPDATIAVLWNDLENFSNAGAVYWQVLGTGGDQRLVVQWHEVGYFAFNPGTITFQAVLSEADGSIQFNYPDLDGGAPFQDEGAAATVGIKDAGSQGPNRLLLAFFDGPNQFVGSGKSTRIAATAPPDFYRVSAADGATLQVETATPARRAGAYVNDLDPMVRIYTPAGVLVASDDNSHPDGRNARVSYRVPRGAGGVYYVEVLASAATAQPTTGEYILTVKGGSAPPSGSPLLAAAVPTGAPAASKLRAAAARPLLHEALRAWQQAGFDTSILGRLNIRVADLGGSTLAMASGNTIWLDDNAAGWGWFVDRTARNDSEFLRAGNQGEQGRMDLLSVLIHEVGHLLGQGHAVDGVMMDTIGTGVRRRPGGAVIG